VAWAVLLMNGLKTISLSGSRAIAHEEKRKTQKHGTQTPVAMLWVGSFSKTSCVRDFNPTIARLVQGRYFSSSTRWIRFQFVSFLTSHRSANQRATGNNITEELVDHE